MVKENDEVLVFDLGNQKEVSKFWLNTFQYQLDRKIYPNECDVMLTHSISLYDTKYNNSNKIAKLLKKVIKNADYNCVDIPDICCFDYERNDDNTFDVIIYFNEKPSQSCIEEFSNNCICPTLMENQELSIIYDGDMIENIELEKMIGNMIDDVDKEVNKYNKLNK